jgi:hypothetical protein
LKTKLFGIGLVCLAVLAAGLLFGKPASAAALPAPTVFAASKADACNSVGFFGLEPWYHFMPDSEIGVNKIGDAPADNCGIKCFNLFVQNAPNDCGETASDVPGVILAIVDDLLRVSAIVAVVFILIGSFQFVGSRGNSERTAGAQSTILSALTGLAIALVAVALVSFLGDQLH